MSTPLETSHPTCPRCQGDFVKRSRRRHLLDRLLGSFSVYPFRCQLCQHRFHSLQKGRTYTRVDEDRREYERLPVDLPASFDTEAGAGQGRVMDLSMGGCALGTEVPLEIGDILQLKLELPAPAGAVEVDVALLRGFLFNHARLEFLRFRNGDRDRLRQFVHGLLSEQPTGRA